MQIHQLNNRKVQFEYREIQIYYEWCATCIMYLIRAQRLGPRCTGKVGCRVLRPPLIRMSHILAHAVHLRSWVRSRVRTCHWVVFIYSTSSYVFWEDCLFNCFYLMNDSIGLSELFIRSNIELVLFNWQFDIVIHLIDCLIVVCLIVAVELSHKHYSYRPGHPGAHLGPGKSMVETPTMAAPWAHAEPLQSYPVIREVSRRMDTAPFGNVNQPY